MFRSILLGFILFAPYALSGTICLYEGASYTGQSNCINFNSNEELCWESSKCSLENKVSSAKWWIDTKTKMSFFKDSGCRGPSKSWDLNQNPYDFSKDHLTDGSNMNDQISSVRIYPYDNPQYFHYRESCSQISYNNLEGHNFCLYSVTIHRTILYPCPSVGGCSNTATQSDGHSMVFREQGDCSIFDTGSSNFEFVNMIAAHKEYLASVTNVRLYGQSRTNSQYGPMVINYMEGYADYEAAQVNKPFAYLITGGRVSRCIKKDTVIVSNRIRNIAAGAYDRIDVRLFGSCLE
jgi:hypothetical protein